MTAEERGCVCFWVGGHLISVNSKKTFEDSALPVNPDETLKPDVSASVAVCFVFTALTRMYA